MKHLGFSVSEVMEGSLLRPGENFDRPFRFDLAVVFPALWRIFLVASGEGRSVLNVVATDGERILGGSRYVMRTK